MQNNEAIYRIISGFNNKPHFYVILIFYQYKSSQRNNFGDLDNKYVQANNVKVHMI